MDKRNMKNKENIKNKGNMKNKENMRYEGNMKYEEEMDNSGNEKDEMSEISQPRMSLWKKIIVWVVIFLLVSWSVGRFYW